MRPLLRVAGEVARCPARGSRPRSPARASSTSGLVAAKFDGAIASTYCRVTKSSRRLSLLGQRRELRELGQVLAARAGRPASSSEKYGKLAPRGRREAAIARRGRDDLGQRMRHARCAPRAPPALRATAPPIAAGSARRARRAPSASIAAVRRRSASARAGRRPATALPRRLRPPLRPLRADVRPCAREVGRRWRIPGMDAVRRHRRQAMRSGSGW